MASSCAKLVSTAELVSYLDSSADAIVPPLVPLSYSAVTAAAALHRESTRPSAVMVPLPAVTALLAAVAILSAALGGWAATRRRLGAADGQSESRKWCASSMI